MNKRRRYLAKRWRAYRRNYSEYCQIAFPSGPPYAKEWPKLPAHPRGPSREQLDVRMMENYRTIFRGLIS